jgi:superfamily II DNA or RNA helicase
LKIRDQKQISHFHQLIKIFSINGLPEKDSHGNPMSPIELYDYQVDLINQVIKHRRGVIYAPTSAGKSKVMFGESFQNFA